MLPNTIIIAGDESARLDPALPDGGLPPLPGVQSFQVFRASKAVPEITDGKGYTYHHHVDMACWRGLLYVAWNSCERDEDVWPSRELYSTSTDGATWSDPHELFPQGTSTALRMYFFHATVGQGGKMLAIAGLRTSTTDTDEDKKSGLLVREIHPDHTLGPVFTLQSTTPTSPPPLPLYTTSTDAIFIQACQQLLADTVYLEQQDRGRLLGDRKMKWHEESNWLGGKVPGDNDKWVAGKAYTFFRRKDDTLVGISKMGWTTFSHDNGATWSQPFVPETLITGKAKVWAQRTADGRYLLAYNPSRDQRFPLAIATSDDGVHFSPLRIVQGELPIQRYPGQHRSIGPQYTRGISAWSTDHSRKEDCVWLVYSMNKEDIWVSRIQLPNQPPQPLTDDFGECLGPIIPRWNTYAPKWTTVAIHQSPEHDGHCLLLRNTDPYDYASATRVFDSHHLLNLSFEVLPPSTDGELQIDLSSDTRSVRPIRLCLVQKRGQVQLIIGPDPFFVPLQWSRINIQADATTNRFSAQLNGLPLLSDSAFAEPASAFNRITFRTSLYRAIGGSHPIDPKSDRPTTPVGFLIRHVRIM